MTARIVAATPPVTVHAESAAELAEQICSRAGPAARR